MGRRTGVTTYSPDEIQRERREQFHRETKRRMLVGGFVLGGLTLLILLVAWIAAPRSGPAPHPAPFSCSSMNATYATIDAGGQVAPLCGATPYDDTLPPDGGDS